jgi:uncharacterized protein (DUF433 family)
MISSRPANDDASHDILGNGLVGEDEVNAMTARITVNPNIHFGKPCVAGTRIPVQNVLELVRDGIPFENIIEAYYPELQIEDIRSCVQYAIEVVAAEEIHIATGAV